MLKSTICKYLGNLESILDTYTPIMLLPMVAITCWSNVEVHYIQSCAHVLRRCLSCCLLVFKWGHLYSIIKVLLSFSKFTAKIIVMYLTAFILFHKAILLEVKDWIYNKDFLSTYLNDYICCNYKIYFSFTPINIFWKVLMKC